MKTLESVSGWTSLPQDERIELIISFLKDNPNQFTALLAKPRFQELLARLAMTALHNNFDVHGDDLSDEMADLVLHELGPIVAEIYEADNDYFDDLEYREYLKAEMRAPIDKRHWL